MNADDRADLVRRGYSEEEIAKLEQQAYAFRAGLVISLAAVGFTDPDGYLAFIDETCP